MYSLFLCSTIFNNSSITFTCYSLFTQQIFLKTLLSSKFLLIYFSGFQQVAQELEKEIDEHSQNMRELERTKQMNIQLILQLDELRKQNETLQNYVNSQGNLPEISVETADDDEEELPPPPLPQDDSTSNLVDSLPVPVPSVGSNSRDPSPRTSIGESK
jgi:hypothetical protein